MEQFVETSDGTLIMANGIDPVLQWDGYAETTRLAGVYPPDQTITPFLSSSGTNAVNGITGTYYCAVRFVDSDGNFSNLSPISNAFAATNALQLIYGNLPIPSQPDVVRRQILRNTNGQASTFYVDIDTTDLGATSLTSSTSDSDLTTHDPVPLLDANGADIANVYTQPPDNKPFIAWHNERMHFAGIEPYTEGSIRLELGSQTVTGSGTEWKSTFVGRYLHVDGAPGPLLITKVTDKLTLTVDQPLTTPPSITFASYAIRPAPQEEKQVYYSEPGLATAVPATNALLLNQDGDTITGMMNYSSFLYYLERRNIYRLTSRVDPKTDGQIYQSANRGCINNRCWAVGSENAYLLDEGGAYIFSENEAAETVTQNIQDIFRPESFSSIKINWAASRYFHAVHSPQEEIIRWYICLGEDRYPRHSLTFCYTTRRWSVEELMVPIGASCLGRAVGIAGTTALGVQQVYLGSRSARMLGLSFDGLDGISASRAPRGVVSAADIQSLTADGFDLSNAVGATVAIVYGRAQYQIREVVEVSGTYIRVDRPWSVVPAVGDVFQIGGVKFEYKTRRMRIVRTESTSARSMETQYIPTQSKTIPQVFRTKIYDDYGTVAKTAGRKMDLGLSRWFSASVGLEGQYNDMTGTGFVKQTFDSGAEMNTDAPKSVSIGIDGIAGPERIRIRSVLLNGVVG